ncbi:MAG: hypothetical protein EOM15_02105 [Spirochaetia bacterium]|nr:hypothetical protein [Spirochaetia bacterium]
MAEKQGIRLLLVTGFLGSGKTSVINNMLDKCCDKTVGLILNDFGSIAVDGALVEQSGKIVATKSLSGGQIFCSCLSGSFVESVVAMAKFDVDIIVVEASGLAKPAPLLEIVSIIQNQTEHRVVYGGMLCVIDAERFELLSCALKTLEEQVVFSDWFLLNKVDLVDDKTCERIKQKIASLRPLAPISMTSYGNVDDRLLPLLLDGPLEVAPKTVDPDQYSGWGLHGRPKTCVFIPQAGYDQESLKHFLAKVSSHLLRMKGFLPISEERVLLVDAVGNHVSFSERANPESFEPGIVCIHAADFDAVSMMKSTWALLSGTPMTCEPF